MCKRHGVCFLNCICVCCIRDENCNCLGVAFFEVRFGGLRIGLLVSASVFVTDLGLLRKLFVVFRLLCFFLNYLVISDEFLKTFKIMTISLFEAFC